MGRRRGESISSAASIWRQGLVWLGVIGMALSLAWIPGNLVKRQSLVLEAQVLDRDVNRLVNGIQSEILVLDELSKDWGNWDDTYRFVVDRNAAFRNANLGWESLLASTRVNLFSILDAQGNPVWSGFRHQPHKDLPVPPFLGGQRQVPSKGGLVLTEEGPLMVAIRPILRSDGSGPARGTLIMGRLLDEAFLRRLMQRESLTFQVSDTLRMVPNAGERARNQRLRSGQYEVDYTAEVATAHAFLPELEGAGGLRVRMPWSRDIYLQGRRAAHTLSITIFFALFVVGAALALSFRWYHLAMKRDQEMLQNLVNVRTAELQEANRALEEASMVDILTGLRNRRFVDFSLPKDIAKVVRIHQEPKQPPLDPPGIGEDMVFLIVDLDHFKAVNDTYGHAAGDAVLQQVGALLRKVCRESDLVARWGGEEFLVVARRTDRAYAPVIAGNLLQAFRNFDFKLPNGMTLQKTCSIGYCPFPLVGDKPEAVAWAQAMEMADLCLYAAKRSGRDGWVGMTPAEGADPEVLAKQLPGGFFDLVEQGGLEITCSFPNPARLNWY